MIYVYSSHGVFTCTNDGAVLSFDTDGYCYGGPYCHPELALTYRFDVWASPRRGDYHLDILSLGHHWLGGGYERPEEGRLPEPTPPGCRLQCCPEHCPNDPCPDLLRGIDSGDVVLRA